MTLRTLTLLAATAMAVLLVGCDVFTCFVQHEVQDKVQDQVSRRVSEDAIVVQRTAVINAEFNLAYINTILPNSYIYVIDQNGANEARSVHAAENKANAVLSPDGEKIAFLSGDLYGGEDPDIVDVYVMDVDGTDRTKITANNPFRDVVSTIRGQPVWSPDSKRVGFTSYTSAETSTTASSSAEPESEPAEEVNGIYVANASGLGVPSMISSSSGDELTWSPDGEKIAFYYGGIEVIKDDDNGQWDRIGPIFNDLEDAQPPYSWSPDGKRIAFVAMFDSDLYVINADGSGRKRLANTIPYSSSGSNPSPIWSPDGKKIAFFCPAPPGSKGRALCMINADGTEWKRLALNVD